MVSRQTLRIGVAVAVVVTAAWFLLVPPSILGTPEISWVTENGVATGKGVLRVPIGRTDDREYELRAWVDRNADGAFDDGELVANDIPFVPKDGDFQNVAIAA